jgi:hypothetical protein
MDGIIFFDEKKIYFFFFFGAAFLAAGFLVAGFLAATFLTGFFLAGIAYSPPLVSFAKYENFPSGFSANVKDKIFFYTFIILRFYF